MCSRGRGNCRPHSQGVGVKTGSSPSVQKQGRGPWGEERENAGVGARRAVPCGGENPWKPRSEPSHREGPWRARWARGRMRQLRLRVVCSRVLSPRRAPAEACQVGARSPMAESSPSATCGCGYWGRHAPRSFTRTLCSPRPHTWHFLPAPTARVQFRGRLTFFEAKRLLMEIDFYWATTLKVLFKMQFMRMGKS